MYKEFLINELIDNAKNNAILSNYFTIDENVDSSNEMLQSIRSSYLESDTYPCIEVEVSDNRTTSKNLKRDETIKAITYNIRCVVSQNSSLCNENGYIMSAINSLEYIADFVENAIAKNFKFTLIARTSIAKNDDKFYIFLRYTATHNKLTNKIY